MTVNEKLYALLRSPWGRREVEAIERSRLGRKILVVGTKDWNDLPPADRTIYLRGAIYAEDEAALLEKLDPTQRSMQ